MYADQQDYENRYGQDELIQLTDFQGVGGVDAGVFAQAQADGDAEIDSYVQACYALPLDPVPPVLVRIAVDLYRYYLMGARVTEQAEKRYKDAIAFLVKVNKGEIQLNRDAAGEPVSTGAVQTVAGDRVFSRDTLGDY